MMVEFGGLGPESDERFHVHGGNDQLAWGLAERLPAGTLQLDRPLQRAAPARLLLRPLLRGHRGRGARRRRRPLPPLPRPAPRRPRRAPASAPASAAASRSSGWAPTRSCSSSSAGTSPTTTAPGTANFTTRRSTPGAARPTSRAAGPCSPSTQAAATAPPSAARSPHGPAPHRRVREALGRISKSVPGLATGWDGDALARPLGLRPLDPRLLRRLRTRPVHPLLGLRRPPRRPPALRRRAHRARRPGLPRGRRPQRRALRARSRELVR